MTNKKNNGNSNGKSKSCRGEGFTFPPIAMRLRWMGHTVYGHGLFVAEGFHGFYS